MCIVSEPNKYNGVKSYFWALVCVFISSVRSRVAPLNLCALRMLEIPNSKT